MKVLRGLYEDKIFDFFEEICGIPHGSQHEQAISDYIVAFAAERGLYCRQDAHYNVLIKKPAAKGYENVPGVILQGHIDMVCEKNADTVKDFLTEPIEIYIKDDFIHAKGTTLGADNGIAVAYMLALLDDSSLQHPPIEAIFTAEEELGMGGAKGFDPYDVEGRRLINMDTEEEGVLLSGCSGGRRIRLQLPVTYQETVADAKAYRLRIQGLKGGHSGADIHLQRANANCLLGRILQQMDDALPFALVRADGGSMDNAICREAEAVIVMQDADAAAAAVLLQKMEKMLRDEYKGQEASITIAWERLEESIAQAWTEATKKSCIHILMLLPYGVQTMCMDLPGLVESSNNIGILKTTAEYIYFDNAVRSSVDSRKEWISAKIRAVATLCGADVEELNDYPGWQYQPDSPLLHMFAQAYRAMYGRDAVISAIHAGLECGLFAEKIPGVDMVSIGPEMYDVHTPDERLSISSAIRVWKFLKYVLKQMTNE